MAAQAKHSCMPGTSEGDHAHVSPTILTCPFEVKMTQAVAKYQNQEKRKYKVLAKG